VLEDFLEKFNGCLILVSHDRYFMDHLVDQLFVFEGDGVVKPFNGNYSDYRIWLEEKELGQTSKAPREKVQERIADTDESIVKRKITFKEKKELEDLQKEIEQLETQKAEVITLLNGGSTDHSKLQEWGVQIDQFTKAIEAKTLRWLELSELDN
jgi:ATPase components of ABC transporters with duplicated ATPase domains